MKYSTKNFASRDNILRRYTEIDIFNWYLGAHLKENAFFVNPFRSDKNPTCNFYRGRDGRLRMIDRAGFFHGDCFDLVSMLNGSCGYHKAVEIIWADLIRGTKTISTELSTIEHEVQYKTKRKILVKRKAWSEETLAYWSQFCIDLATLKRFNVYPLEVVWVGEKTYKKNEVGRWNNTSPVFGYNLAPGEWKIYFPNRKPGDGPRFLGNTSKLQGLDQLQDSKYLVITKSLKDVMVLSLFGIPSVAPHSESYVIKEIDEILNYYEIVFIFFDNDGPGKRGAVKYKQEGCVPLLLKNKKDISDFIRDFDFEQTKTLIDEIKDTYWIGR